MGLKRTTFWRKSRYWQGRRSYSRLLKGLFLFLALFFPLHLKSQSSTDLYKIHLEKVRKGAQKISFYPSVRDWNGTLEFPYYSKDLYWPLPPGEFIKDQKAYDTNGLKLKKGTGPVNRMEYGYYGPKRTSPGLFPSFKPELDHGRQYFFDPVTAFGSVPEIRSPKTFRFNNPRKLWSTLNHGELQEEIHEISVSGQEELQKQLIFFSRHEPLSISNNGLELMVWGTQENEFISNLYSTGILSELFSIYERMSLRSSGKVHLVFKKGEKTTKVLDDKKSVRVFEKGVVIHYSEQDLSDEILVKISRAFSKLFIVNDILKGQYWKGAVQPHNPGHLWLIESVSDYLASINLLRVKAYSDSWFKDKALEAIVEEIKKQPESFYTLGADLYRTEGSKKELKANLARMESFYQRGTLTAFYLDITLKQNNPYQGLITWLRDYRGFCDQEIDLSKNKDPWGLYLRIQQDHIKNLIDANVYGDKTLEHDFYLNRIGWDFIKKGEEHRTFLKGGKLHYFHEIGHYVCVKKGKNTLGMEKGDVIISINNNEVFNDYDLKELIFVNNKIRNELSVKVLVLRNGVEKVLRGKATKKVRTKHFELMPDSDPLTDQYRLRKDLFSTVN